MAKPIPVIRDRMQEIAQEMLGDTCRPIVEIANEIRALAEETKRRPEARPRTPAKIEALTPERAQEILSYASAFPDASHLDLANMFGTNPGRVSEVIAGKRTATIAPYRKQRKETVRLDVC